jgi:succinate dehydrogenase/fumarate reductase-like Fe-S protein
MAVTKSADLQALTTFAQALDARLENEILDRCTLCGKCVVACPMPAPAGLDVADESDGARVVAAVIELLRGGQGSDEGRQWAEMCTGSGYCISCWRWRGSRHGGAAART